MGGYVEEHHGSFRYVLPYVDETGKRHRKTGGGHRTKKAARDALLAEQSKLARGYSLAADKITVVDWLDVWLESKVDIRATTRRSYKMHIDAHLSPAIGTVPLGKLNAAHLDRMYAAMRARKDRLEPATILRIHATLRAALNAAYRRGLIGTNPATQVSLERVTRKRLPIWTFEQLAIFLDATASDRWHVAYRLAALTGLRRGELLALNWADVDLDLGVLRVVASKSDAGIRTVSLDADTVDVLKSARRRTVVERLAAGEAYHDTDRVVVWPDGTSPDPTFLLKHFKELSVAAGLPVIRLHDLRHTHASHALASGVALKVVSDRLGHSSIQLTADTYTKVLPEVDRAAADLVASRLRSARPTP